LPLWPEAEDWGTFVYLFGFFVAGYVLMSDPRLMEAVRRGVVPALCLAVVGDVAILLTGVPAIVDRWQDAPSYSWMCAWAFFLIGVQAWAWLQVLLGLGMRAPWFQRPLSRSVAAAAMPFFIVHQPIILTIAFFVVRWDAGIAVKWGVIVLGSFALTAAVATAIVRLPVISITFGVKRGTRSVTRPTNSSATPVHR
jgi:hypothetical protein